MGRKETVWFGMPTAGLIVLAAVIVSDDCEDHLPLGTDEALHEDATEPRRVSTDGSDRSRPIAHTSDDPTPIAIHATSLAAKLILAPLCKAGLPVTPDHGSDLRLQQHPAGSNKPALPTGHIAATVAYRFGVFVVRGRNPVRSAFPDTLHKLLDGRLATWEPLGFDGGPIEWVTLRAGDSALQLGGEPRGIPLATEDQVIDFVSRGHRAIGLVSAARLRAARVHVHAIAWLGIPATPANAERYPLTTTFVLVYKRNDPQAQRLFTLLQHPDTRRLLHETVTLPPLTEQPPDPGQGQAAASPR